MRILFTATDAVGELTALEKIWNSIPMERILVGVIVLAASLLVAHLLLRLVRRVLCKTKLDKSLHRFILSLLKVLVYFICILLFCGTVGIDVTSLIAVLSVVSLAISLAVQDVLSNLAGGTMILGTKPFRQGDWVQIDDMTGTVDEIGIFYTRLITADNRKIFLPNSKVSSGVIQNYSALGKRRLDMTFSASYDNEPEAVKAALHSAIDFPLLLPDDSIVEVADYGDSDISYQVCVWVRPENYLTAKYELTERVWAAFRDAGIEMSYPHLKVHIEQK